MDDTEFKPFEFKSESDYVDWYFEQCYILIDKRYGTWFGKNCIKRVVRGIHKGLVEGLKERELKKEVNK